MRFEDSVQIEAPAARVWETLVDVERWPEWTASMAKVEIFGGAPLAPGARVHIKQPRLRAGDWEVVEFRPGVVFTWKNTAPGLTTVGTHRVAPAGTDRATVSLAFEQSGVLAPLVGRFSAGIIRRYMGMEAEGLKQRCEARDSAHERG